MTLAEIEKLPNDMLTPEIVGKFGIRQQAQTRTNLASQ